MSKMTQRNVSAFEDGRQFGLIFRQQRQEHPDKPTTRKNRMAKHINKLYKMNWLLGCNAGIAGELSGKQQKLIKQQGFLKLKKKILKRA